ncbi:hypothetical protein TD95_002746 [Thielaviopsis punctulata]|uniref:Meiotically up-regulated gene 154 protein n=1 Tax=Thielaviopsis punctulata TaxID=72032 RepID=A0A0F4ZKV4_9PEZI|nr:hypothetical protein TD95_002746 [Thielaviopsis punctulata]
MAPTRRLVRKRPLMQRITAYLNPMDFLLWLSEELETREYDPQSLGLKLGLAMHFIFVLALSNSVDDDPDDIFGDSTSTSSLSYLSRAIVCTLGIVSLVNAYSAMTRVRLYRLFQHNIDDTPDTSSAQRVSVFSNPVAASPLRMLANAFKSETAEERAHPDRTRDVWELSVWDPMPLCLRVMCIFSPAHVLIYLLALPISPDDPQPSLTVFNCLIVQTLFSAQLLLLKSQFAQQSKDTALINREVMNEYTIKFVHPRLYPQVRDASTQANITESNKKLRIEMSSAVGTPTTPLHRSFQTHPNQNYSRAYDPEGHSNTPNVNNARTPNINNICAPTINNIRMNVPSMTRTVDSIESPSVAASQRAAMRKNAAAAMVSKGTSAPVAPTTIAPTPVPEALRSRASTATTAGIPGTSNLNFGGNMGIHTHNRSPLKKSMGVNDVPVSSPRNSREMAALEQKDWKRPMSRNPFAETDRKPRVSQSPVRPARKPQQPQERYPSRWG